MANADVNAVGAAWRVVWGCQVEALSLVELWDGNPDAEAWASLADRALSRFSTAVESLEAAYRASDMSPIEAAWGNGGMGAVAPMETQGVEGQLANTRK